MGRSKTTRSLAYYRRQLQCRLTDTDAFEAHDDALGVQPVEEVLEAVAHLAHDLVVTDLEVVDEQLVGVDRRPAQLLDFADRDPLAVQVGEEQRHPVQRLLLVAGRRARQQQDLACVLRVADPDFLTVDDPAAVDLLGLGRDARGVHAGGGFGDAERHEDLAAGELGQELLLHLLPSRGG